MKEFFYLSADGRTQIRAACWEPPCAPRAILQFVHGMYEHMGWYDPFARWLAAQGFLVVGNDHLGHGLSVAGEENRGFFAQPNGNGCVLQDIHTLRTLTQKNHPQLPYFILGHSMGSFLTRQYIQRHGQGLAGAILMGTGSQSALTLLAARTIARLSACAKGWQSRSALLDKLTTGGFNRRFQPVKTGYEWITSDEEIAASYGRDPLRCFRFTVNAYDNMFVSIGEAQSARRMKGIPKSLPLLLISGECDPVGGFGKGGSGGLCALSGGRLAGGSLPALSRLPPRAAERGEPRNRIRRSAGLDECPHGSGPERINSRAAVSVLFHRAGGAFALPARCFFRCSGFCTNDFSFWGRCYIIE